VPGRRAHGLLLPRRRRARGAARAHPDPAPERGVTALLESLRRARARLAPARSRRRRRRRRHVGHVARRLLVLRNVLKAWLILVTLAGLFGLAGWQLGGYRVALLFSGSIVLLAAAVYAYADRIVKGMLGAREL